VQGRKNIWQKLKIAIDHTQQGQLPPQITWIHCASLGEFEQGRPLIEAIRSGYPRHKILLTFFSPSGYEIRKDYKGADWVFYLPMDGAGHAKLFLQIVKPSLVIFVKYEFWYYYLREIKRNKIPLLLVSALFRKNSGFFKWYGGLQRKMLSFFEHLFVQNEVSKQLLDSIGLAADCTVSGDTRFDRVIDIAENSAPIPIIEQFTANHKAIIAGSTWKEDEELLKKTMLSINNPTLKLVIAPHEIHPEHISQLLKLFPSAVRYSQLETSNLVSSISNILIIDNIGMLSRLYKYAYITYIGGGFGKGIHNTLEAAVYAKPVIFGPVYHKFKEAIDLIKAGGAVSINHAEDCIVNVEKLLRDEKEYEAGCKSAGDYVYANRGATKKIMQFIQEKRLLTN